MVGAELDTRPWDLTRGVATLGLAACGPVVPMPADTDDGGETTGHGTSSDTGVPATTTTTTTTLPTTTFPTTTVGPGCGGGPPCPPGYTCVYGEYCRYDGFCDTACSYCLGHDDCEDDSYCDFDGSCRAAAELPDCVPGNALSLEIIPMNIDGAHSLAFAETNGDGLGDFVTLSADVLSVLRGPDSSDVLSIPLILRTRSSHVIGTDIDGVAPEEVTFSLVDDGFLVTVSVITGLDPVAEVPYGPRWPAAGDFDADGDDDVVGLFDDEVYVRFSDGNEFGDPEGLPSSESNAPPAVGTLGDQPGEDYAFASGGVLVAEVWPGGGSLRVLEELVSFDTRTPAVGDFDGDGDDDVIAIADRGGGSHGIVAAWRQSGQANFIRLPYVSVPGVELSVDAVFPLAVGDFDGDGADDVVVGGAELTILFGAPGGDGMFACSAVVPLPSTARCVAAGDHDGNGRDDVAWSDGVAITRVLLSG